MLFLQRDIIDLFIKHTGMAFEGQFVRYVHRSTDIITTEIPTWSFVLTNSGLFSQQVRAEISDFERVVSIPPIYFEAKSRTSYYLNMDTINWVWHQGDIIILYDQSGQKELGHWEFYLKEYAFGECPECHGLGLCPACKGHPHDLLENPVGYGFTPITCQHCHGNGKCPTCYVPYRHDNIGQLRIPQRTPRTNKSKMDLGKELSAKEAALGRCLIEKTQLELQGKKFSTDYSVLIKKIAQLQSEISLINRQINS